jgi:hypothetical protein
MILRRQTGEYQPRNAVVMSFLTRILFVLTSGFWPTQSAAPSAARALKRIKGATT